MALKGFVPPKPKKQRAPMTAARPTASVGGAEPLQSLNVVEEKLRREFNLVGTIGAHLERGLTPVIIAADLRDMGHAVDRGRGWAVTGPIAAGFAANGHFSFLFNADVLVEYFNFSASAGDDILLYTTTATEAIPIAANVASGAWRDRKVNSADAPPIFMSAAAGALTGTAVSNSNRIYAFRCGANNPTGGAIPLQIMLPAGSALTFKAGAAGVAIANFGCWGRIWP